MLQKQRHSLPAHVGKKPRAQAFPYTMFFFSFLPLFAGEEAVIVRRLSKKNIPYSPLTSPIIIDTQISSIT
jgi:hypothetical protein